MIHHCEGGVSERYHRGAGLFPIQMVLKKPHVLASPLLGRRYMQAPGRHGRQSTDSLTVTRLKARTRQGRGQCQTEKWVCARTGRRACRRSAPSPWMSASRRLKPRYIHCREGREALAGSGETLAPASGEVMLKGIAGGRTARGHG